MDANTPGSAATQQRLTSLVSEVVLEAGFDLEDLVQIPMGRRCLFRVVIDRDEGVCLDDIAGLSHAVAEVLDQDEGAMGKAPYVLEVSSPGVERPLTEPRHWRRAAGRLVEVTLYGASSPDDARGSEGTSVRARVIGFDGTSVTLNLDGVQHVVPLGDLGAGKVQLEFNRPDDARPGDPGKPERRQRQHGNRKNRGDVTDADTRTTAASIRPKAGRAS